MTVYGRDFEDDGEEWSASQWLWIPSWHSQWGVPLRMTIKGREGDEDREGGRRIGIATPNMGINLFYEYFS